jgi:hypothetical protein
MATKRTWLLIIGGAVAFCVLALIVIAGAGMYFVSQHVSTERSTGADAIRAFETARKRYKEPLFEIDRTEHLKIIRPLAEMPTSGDKPEYMWILAWDPDDERLVKLSLPFWLLKMGRRKIDIMQEEGFSLDRLNLDIHELERIGPALVVDYRTPSGERVLIWTQ